MREDEPPPHHQPTPKPELPKPGEQVVVPCPGFRCLAYLDSKGVWHNAHDGAELPSVLEILFRF